MAGVPCIHAWYLHDLLYMTDLGYHACILVTDSISQRLHHMLVKLVALVTSYASESKFSLLSTNTN